MNHGSAQPSGTRRATPLFLIGVGLAFAFELYGLFFPGRASFRRYPLAVPDPFTDLPALRPLVPLAILIAGCLLLALAVRMLPSLAARPWRTTIGLFALGLSLHFAMIGSLQGGFQAFHRRALFSGHREFLYASVWARDLPDTLRHYEAFVQGRTFLLNKGPGITVVYHTLRVIANAGPVKPLIEPLSLPASVIESWTAEQGMSFPSGQIDELRHLLGLMFVVFPVLTYLPIFLLFWLGRTLADDVLGLLAATLYLFVPSVGLLVAHLDTALFPLLVCAVMTLFAIGVRRRSLLFVTASAAVFTFYFTITLAAAALAAFFLPYLGMVCWSRRRQGDAAVRVAADVLKVCGVFAGVVVALLLLVSIGFRLDLVERYRVARTIQAGWTTSEYNFFWARADALGWFLSFGLAQSLLLVAQEGRSLWRVVTAAFDAVDEVALGWLGLLGGLLVLGRQHGETNRMWTFLAPIACLVLARLLHDKLPARRYTVPLCLFLAGLVLTRYRLSYF